jgi:hypothetical protein
MSAVHVQCNHNCVLFRSFCELVKGSTCHVLRNSRLLCMMPATSGFASKNQQPKNTSKSSLVIRNLE